MLGSSPLISNQKPFQTNKMRQLIYLAIVLCFAVQHISAECCNFDGNDCSYDLGYWQWSQVNKPVNPPTSFASHTPNYIWAEPTTGNAQATSQLILINNQFTYVSFDYYYSNSHFSTGSYLNIYFIPDGSSYRFPLLQTYIPNNNWISEKVPCSYGTSYCCGLPGASCYGRIEILATLDQPYYDALFGVDNVGTTCDSYPEECCTIKDTLSCGFDNSVLNSYYWLNSMTSTPVSPPPYPVSGGSYAYFEIVNNIALDAITSDFVSDQITIPASISFQANLYVQSSSATNGLYIYFRESTTNLKTQLAFITSTYGSWLDISFQCGGTSYDCCFSQATCSGSIVLTANVEGLGETVLYAVNRIGKEPC